MVGASLLFDVCVLLDFAPVPLLLRIIENHGVNVYGLSHKIKLLLLTTATGCTVSMGISWNHGFTFFLVRPKSLLCVRGFLNFVCLSQVQMQL